eukprot:scaffold614_cov367-Prasinococcus_capsulatus_cf.AAC.33
MCLGVRADGALLAAGLPLLPPSQHCLHHHHHHHHSTIAAAVVVVCPPPAGGPRSNRQPRQRRRSPRRGGGGSAVADGSASVVWGPRADVAVAVARASRPSDMSGAGGQGAGAGPGVPRWRVGERNIRPPSAPSTCPSRRGKALPSRALQAPLLGAERRSARARST